MVRVTVPLCMGALLALCLSCSFLWLEGVCFWDRDGFLRSAQAGCRNRNKCQHFSPWPRVTASTLHPLLVFLSMPTQQPRRAVHNPV
ncbi:hypothetical protein EDD85DRAFT_856424 [Armillaria nabsnona]|nr:hypothetical protein EDD85DRAFT_856424 [Armillaria nabsnona]